MTLVSQQAQAELIMPIGARGLWLENTLLSLLTGIKGHSWKSRDIMGQSICQVLQSARKSHVFCCQSVDLTLSNLKTKSVKSQSGMSILNTQSTTSFLYVKLCPDNNVDESISKCIHFKMSGIQ